MIDAIDFCLGLWYNGNMQTPNKQSKSILSRLLATENISVIHRADARTASFNVRDRVLVLPILSDNMSNELYDMIVGHEVGHALFTPYTEEDEKSIRKGNGMSAAHKIGGDNFQLAGTYLNIVEDARIEKLMKEKFAGLRRDFNIGYKELHDMDFFEVKDKDVSLLSFIDRINLHYKVGTYIDNYISFNEVEMKFINEIDEARTFEQVIDITTRIWEYTKDERTNSPKTVNQSTKFDPNGTKGMNGTGSTMQDDGSPSNGSRQADNYTNIPIIGSTQRTFDAKSNLLNNNLYKNYEYQTIPDLKNNPIVDFKKIMNYFNPYSNSHPNPYANADTQYQEFSNKSKNAVNILVKQFLTKKAAKDSHRASIHRSGSIDSVRMMNYMFTDDIFLRMKTVKKGKSHGLVFYIDWSGSMGASLPDTLRQLFQIVFFCRRMNIPYEVFAFSSLGVDLEEYSKRWSYPAGFMGNQHAFHNFSLLNLLSSRMKTHEFNTMMRNLFVIIDAYSPRSRNGYSPIPPELSLSSTPLDEAIISAIDFVPKFKRDNSLDIVHTVFLTDGETTGSALPPSNGMYKNFFTYKGQSYIIKEGQSTSDCLYSILRDVTGSKVVGIFLDGRRRGGMSAYASVRYFDDSTKADALKFYENEGFASAQATRHGCNELFIVQGNTEIDDDDLDEVLSTKKSNVGIRNAFIKTMDNKTSSRIMLNRFIDQIATE